MLYNKSPQEIRSKLYNNQQVLQQVAQLFVQHIYMARSA